MIKLIYKKIYNSKSLYKFLIKNLFKDKIIAARKKIYLEETAYLIQDYLIIINISQKPDGLGKEQRIVRYKFDESKKKYGSKATVWNSAHESNKDSIIDVLNNYLINLSRPYPYDDDIYLRYNKIIKVYDNLFILKDLTI
jgi:hypothetical protein